MRSADLYRQRSSIINEQGSCLRIDSDPSSNQRLVERIGRNPQTNEPITISARRVLTFKPSQVLKNALNS